MLISCLDVTSFVVIILNDLINDLKLIDSSLSKAYMFVVDIWDGPNDEPIIFHGHTLTSKILFKDAVKACKDYAFKTSE